MRAFSTGPKTLAFNRWLLVLIVLARELFAIVPVVWDVVIWARLLSGWG